MGSIIVMISKLKNAMTKIVQFVNIRKISNYLKSNGKRIEMVTVVVRLVGLKVMKIYRNIVIVMHTSIQME